MLLSSLDPEAVSSVVVMKSVVVRTPDPKFLSNPRYQPAKYVIIAIVGASRKSLVPRSLADGLISVGSSVVVVESSCFTCEVVMAESRMTMRNV